MFVEPGAYHPYAACLMFRGCNDGDLVTANLDAVRAHGAQYDSGFDDMADRVAELEAQKGRCSIHGECPACRTNRVIGDPREIVGFTVDASEKP